MKYILYAVLWIMVGLGSGIFMSDYTNRPLTLPIAVLCTLSAPIAVFTAAIIVVERTGDICVYNCKE